MSGSNGSNGHAGQNGSSNGSTNGDGHHGPALPSGGLGGEVHDRRHTRGALALLQQAVENGQMVEADMRPAVAHAQEIVAAKYESDGKEFYVYSTRERLRAMEFLESVANRRISAAVELDKIERLDRGEATEIQGNVTMNVEEAEPPKDRVANPFE